MGHCVSRDSTRGSTVSPGDLLVSVDIEALIKLAGSASPKVQQGAIQRLAQLAELDQNQVNIVKKGGLKPLGVVLEAHSSIDVQRVSCAAIANLALSEENQNRVVDELGLRKILSLALSHDHQVQRYVAGAIANLAYCNAKIEEKVVEEGGLAPLILLARSGEVDVACEAAAALANLARNPKNRDQLNTESSKQASRALSNLSLSDSNKREIVARGGLETLRYLLSDTNNEVLRHAVTTLANLSSVPAISATMVQDGVVGDLLPMLCGASEDIQLQIFFAFSGGRLKCSWQPTTHWRQVARTVANASVPEGNRGCLVQGGSIQLLIKLSRTENTVIHELARQALSNIASAGSLSQSC